MQLLVISALFGLAAAAYSPAYPEQSNRPQASFEKNARILALDSDVKEDSFRYNYETENGIKAEEQGREVDGIEAQGGFQYTGDDGQVYAISYAAGQGGFQAQGAHIPTAPPTPEAILKALEQNARDEAAGIIDDGQYNPGKYGDASFPQQQYRAQAQASASYRQPYKY
ncbi:cuticle protein 3-like [Bombyx mandarina]|uniref:Cuticle protein 3-like n=2 Tax=Bombyx TaxID=7090 RepID=A0A6J2KF76_BOMMA|nr:cuticular protein RR-1 motif 17 precursor [Bombyx mori]XP_028038884.1 cuticle protein 3-like [Bombyx mandarina]FAA00519.1 TPA: putative cuticle protein [Bombyx mori]